MSSALTTQAQTHELYDRLAAFDDTLVDADGRRRALDRFFSLRSGHERPGRFWRIDFESLAPPPGAVTPGAAQVSAEHRDSAVVVCDLATAARTYPELLARALATTEVAETKFGALARAFAESGIFTYVPADHACDEPVVVRYHASAGAAIFPWTVVLAERGARVTVIERITAEAGAFVCAASEIVSLEHADVTYAVVQNADSEAQILATRSSRPGRDSRIAWNVAEIGGALAAGDLRVSIEEPGIDAHVAALFFPRGAQHVDLINTIDHRAGEATSQTLVKSAARERGQARFLGNIRIAAHAQGSDARLRDDALLLSPTAHVDSVPALEIAANDVKAYHGATVGAIDVDQIFYMESRGIGRDDAERMIALGFFEPAIERFPTAALRDEIRSALETKLA